ncbi:hypothetical protein PKHYL_23340 [Psychrobacter sp. KH172YL61]|uniref:hypothetical protein n=1 Tax=Psychrobacter sp. KH172YL61 TaxID=2517899 RepID=UPI0010B0DF44|nr:hypothetical protein [Psychrobacter sp. KH172YL61]BBI68143.1 hypothetical protein PKHYL_23340 [Psychrobacter sp. KH172YL61]
MSIHIMHNAPAVYVPTEPEGNGLTLPTLLSLLAHGLIIGILIYNYQTTEVETAGSIETVMVTPEQLAEMQGQILANRAAASAMQMDSSTSDSASSAQQETSSSSSSSAQNPSQPNSQRVPVFTRSDEPASQPMLMSEEQHQRLREQNQEYERRMAEWAAQLDESAIEELDQVEQDKREQMIEEQKGLEIFAKSKTIHPRSDAPRLTIVIYRLIPMALAMQAEPLVSQMVNQPSPARPQPLVLLKVVVALPQVVVAVPAIVKSSI